MKDIKGFIQQEFKNILVNYKTSFSALAIVICIVLYLFDEITTEQLTVVVSLITGFGFLGSRDSKNKIENE